MPALLTVALLVAACAAETPRKQTKSPPGYDELLAQAKRGDHDVDYQALHYAFASTPAYDPYYTGSAP